MKNSHLLDKLKMELDDLNNILLNQKTPEEILSIEKQITTIIGYMKVTESNEFDKDVWVNETVTKIIDLLKSELPPYRVFDIECFDSFRYKTQNELRWLLKNSMFYTGS